MTRVCIGFWLAAALLLGSDRDSKVDEIFRPFTAAGSPGCAVGALEKGEIALARGYGLADLDHNLPLTPTSRFYMASVSKQFTSMAALLAGHEHKLSLDDDVRKYVPELPAYASGITLRRMLDHTAGLRDYLGLWSLKGFSNESVLKVGPSLSLVTRQKALDFEPGTGYSYSNSGYLLMAVVIERATGKTLAEYAQEKIFAPLGMTATRFQDDHSRPVPERAHGYRKTPGGWRTADVNFDIVGSGGLYSNIQDMLKWARNFEAPTVGAALLERLQTPGHLISGVETPGGYALGITRQKRGGLTVISHSGGATGYTTHFLRVPEKGLAVITLCNGTQSAARLAESVAEVYLGMALPRAEAAGAPQPQPPPKPRPATAADRKAIVGGYWSGELEETWHILEDGELLKVQSTGGETTLFKLSASTYRAGPAVLHLKQSGDGRVASFTIEMGRTKDIEFVRR